MVRPPPLDADIEFVAGSGVGCKRHALVVDILFISDPDVAERARWDLETEVTQHDHRPLLLPSAGQEQDFERTKAWQGQKAAGSSMSKQTEQSLVEQLSSRRRLWLT